MAGLFYSKKIGTRKFYGESAKDAYMKAVKWYASNVIAKDKLHNVQVEYIKSEEEGNYVMSVKLFAVLSEKEARERHCTNCKEMHRLFFINEATECSRCSAAGYQRRLEEMIQIKAQYYKEILGDD